MIFRYRLSECFYFSIDDEMVIRYGNEDAIEEIDFQLPGQSSNPKVLLFVYISLSEIGGFLFVV